MKKIIGRDSYKLLVDDLVDYSSVVEWDEDTTYSLGALKRFNGIVYKVIVATTTNNDEPDCSSEWVEADMFNSACYNRTWVEGGLRDIICWYIYAAAVPFYPQILNVAGFTPNPDSSMKDNIGYYLNHVYKEIQKMKNEFFCWYEEDTDNQCLKIDMCYTTQKVDQNKTHRKIAW